jgi:serine protease Do
LKSEAMPRTRNRTRNVAAAVLAAAALLAIAATVWRAAGPSLRAEPAGGRDLARELEDLFASVAAGVKLSVVAIDSRAPVEEVSLTDPPGDGGGRGGEEEESIGSGFIIDSRGYILTNEHLIDGACEIAVKLHDDREVEAKVVQVDSSSDIALLKIEAEGLRPLAMGNSEDARVGQWVLAIGNPFGLTQTVSAGIISALRRADLRILPFENFIQTDASINPGNSGGPLVNLRGEAIGINTAMYSNPGGGNQGIGFAVPIDLARALAERWIEGKSASFLGILPARVDPEMARYFGLDEPRGAFLARVDAGSPAHAGGLEARDVVLAFGPATVRDENHLRVLIASAPPGKPVRVEVLRGGRRLEREVVPLEKEVPVPAAASPAAGSQKARLLGITVTPLNPELAEKLGVDTARRGLAVLDVQPMSQAARKGLDKGDAITEINERPVIEPGAAEEALEAGGPIAMLTVIRANGDLRYLFLQR